MLMQNERTECRASSLPDGARRKSIPKEESLLCDARNSHNISDNWNEPRCSTHYTNDSQEDQKLKVYEIDEGFSVYPP